MGMMGYALENANYSWRNQHLAHGRSDLQLGSFRTMECGVSTGPCEKETNAELQYQRAELFGVEPRIVAMVHYKVN